MAKKDTMSARDLIDLVSGKVKNKPIIVGENKDKYNCEFYLDTGIPLLNCILYIFRRSQTYKYNYSITPRII